MPWVVRAGFCVALIVGCSGREAAEPTPDTPPATDEASKAGTTPTDPPPAAADPPPAAPPVAPAQAVKTVADALAAAEDVGALRRAYLTRLPSVAEGQRAAFEAVAADPARTALERTAALTVLGSAGDPARALAVRASLNNAIKQTANSGRDTALAVRLMTTVHPPLETALAAVPPLVAESLEPISDGEASGWKAGAATSALPVLSPADVPSLIRTSLDGRATSTRMAVLLLATIDDAGATDALLSLPPTWLTEPRPRRDLVEWALHLHATLPGVPARLRAAEAGTRGHARAVAVLTARHDGAVAADAAALLDRMAKAPPGPLPFDLRGFIDAAGAWGDDGVTAALARYGETDRPLRARARQFARKAGVGPDIGALLDRVAADPTDARARLAVRDRLGPTEAPRLVALLARERWSTGGFFHWVRMLQQVPPTALTPAVQEALAAVAGAHPDARTREWALGALARGEGPAPAVVDAAAAKGSRAAVKAAVMRAPDPWTALWSRMTSDDDAVRRAAYETAIAPRLLPFEPTAAQIAQILEHTAAHLTKRPEDPWVFLRAAQQYVALSDGQRSPALEAKLATALRPYCITPSPDRKPYWEALVAVANLTVPAAQTVLKDAVASVPTAGGRAVMRARLGLPPDPNDPVPEPPRAPSRGGGGH